MTDCAHLPIRGLLDALEARGVRLSVTAGNLSVRPWKRVSPGERERLRTDREAVIAMLTSAEPEPAELPDVPEPKTEPAPEPKETEKERTLRRWRALGPGAFTRQGRRAYAALLTAADVPETDMTAAEIVLLREDFAARFDLLHERT